jgi:transcription elongation factor GreB
MTPESQSRLAAEIEQLMRVERPRVVQEVADAAAQGDRSENAEYIYGKRRLREIDSRVRHLSKRLRDATVVDPLRQSGDKVLFGAHVEIEDEDGALRVYQIVGEDDRVAEGVQKLSWNSPLGRALLGRRAGDTVQVNTPAGGTREYTVVVLWFGGRPREHAE